MTTLVKEGLDRPIDNSRELVDYLLAGARPRSGWGIGAESEKLVIDQSTGAAAPYHKIEELLGRLEAAGDWQAIREGEHIIGLKGPYSSVSLEPGGQLELSGQFCLDIHCCQGDYDGYSRKVMAEAQPLGLSLLGLGAQPFSPLESIGWVPKERYGIMGPYMLRTGDMGQRMMKQTAGLQVNVDFESEADCLEKLRLCQLLVPLLYALFANSPILDGKPSGFLSTRGEIWSRTDPDRTGLIEPLFDEGATLDSYVDHALDVPMYFIVRQGRFVDLTGQRFTFRRFLASGFQGERPLLADWDLHLSTIFTEVRLRPQVELRSADSLPRHQTLAVAALAKGLLYDRLARQEALKLLSGPSAGERNELLRDSWRLALRAPMGSRTLKEVAIDILSLAGEGLKRQRMLDERGLDETTYLEPVKEIAESGVTLAERLLRDWKGDRDSRLQAVMHHCAYTPLP